MQTVHYIGIVAVMFCITRINSLKISRNFIVRLRPVMSDDSAYHFASTLKANQEEEQLLIDKLKQHDLETPRISMAENIKTLIHNSLHYGVLSTNSLQFPGYPTGSIVGFELDESSKPFFIFSRMSAHTKDIARDGKVSLTVTAKDFKGAADGRVVLVGDVKAVESDAQDAKLRELYRATHKDAYWTDFGDFLCYSMETIRAVRYVGGFARAGSVTPEEFMQARPDPCASYASDVISHMNSDHRDSLEAMVKHALGVECTDAKMVGLDRLGITVDAKFIIVNEDMFHTVRLPFPTSVIERKDVKTMIMEMADAAWVNHNPFGIKK